jgi:CheY-like chemotaxis protein
LRILIVEDDEALAEALASLLEDEGYAAVPVPDGRAALAKLRDGEKTGLILLDMSMPVMNGWQFREEQLKDAALAAVPVVVCTADGCAEENARSLGAAGWLRKPIDPERLLELVGKHCSRASRPSSAG